MNPTPTAKPMGTESRDRFTRQIDGAFESASKLAGSNLAPAEFYAQFLNHALTAIDAPAGAIWLRTPQGFLQMACQLNLEKVGLEGKRGGRQCHNEALRMVFQANPPAPLMLEPNGRIGTGPSTNSGVPAANLTDFFALFAPIIAPDKTPLGVLEVFQDPTHDPRLYPTFLNFTLQMAGYASQYHQFSTTRSATGLEKSFTQIEAFARLVHSSLNPTQVAYHVANEGRKAVECDRICVGVRHARKKITVEAVSGADVVEKASTHVRRMRALMESVNAWGEPLTFKGAKDEGLPPAVSDALDAYLVESNPKLLVVMPVRDDREDATEAAKKKSARTVLLMEAFNPPEQTEPLVQRLEVIGKHAAPALYNAAEMKRVPLKFLWWPLAKLQDGLGGKARFFLFGALALVAGLVTALVLVPAPLRMDAKGQLVPVEVAQVFAYREGQVKDILVKPRQQVQAGDPAVYLYSEQLDKELSDVNNKLNEERVKANAAQTALVGFRGSAEEKFRLETERSMAELRRDDFKATLDTLRRTYHADDRLRGAFVATFEDEKRRPPGEVSWTVLNDDKRESLKGRTVRPNEPLVRVGNLAGLWHVEMKIPQRNVGHVLQAFATPGMFKLDADKKPYLDVDVLLASQTDRSYLGRLYQEGIAGEAVPSKDEHAENEPIVTAYVKLNLDDFPEAGKIDPRQFTTGLEVRTRIRCGDHSLGYSTFHGVWEWFYEKVIFWF